jgi:hypothetical protein
MQGPIYRGRVHQYIGRHAPEVSSQGSVSYDTQLAGCSFMFCKVEGLKVYHL